MPASMQRARMLTWEMGKIGWEVEILTPSAEFQQDVWLEPAARHFFKPGIACHEAKPIILDRLLYMLGMKSAAWRGLIPMYCLGAKLLTKRKYSVIYFSTTTFTFFCLGRLWLRHFRRPYILDFQDPWYKPCHKNTLTGGDVKFRLSNRLAKYLESFAIRGASGVVSVSPGYLKTLVERYGDITALRKDNMAVIPFGALERDLGARMAVEGAVSDHADIRVVAYVGVGNIIMQRSFRRIVKTLAKLRLERPDLVNPVRLLLYGTQGGWHPGDRKVLWEDAVSAGVGDLVIEQPSIVSYSTAISHALAADGLLVLGVDDPDYMPSKLFTYAFTGKPLLVSLHSESQANDYFGSFPDLGTLIHFNDTDKAPEEEEQKLVEFLSNLKTRKRFDRSGVKQQFSASSMAAQHASHFERCLQSALGP